MVLAILSSLRGGCVTVGTLTVQRKENTLMAKRDGGQVSGIAPDDSGHNEASSELLRELVAHLRQNRTQLREESVRTHHSARRRNPRSCWNRSSASRRPRTLSLRQVPDGFQEIEPHLRCL